MRHTRSGSLPKHFEQKIEEAFIYKHKSVAYKILQEWKKNQL